MVYKGDEKRKGELWRYVYLSRVGNGHALMCWMGGYFRFDLDGTETKMLDGVGISNGIGWSPDGSIMCAYFPKSISSVLTLVL
jgi:sugar lactone lactonase YvrE